MKKTVLLMLVLCGALMGTAKEIVLQDIPFRPGDLKAKSIDNWMLQRYWGGEISRSQGVLTFKSTDTGKRVWGRVMSPLRNCNPSGMKLKFTCRVKGSGQFSIGAIRYRAGVTGGPKPEDFSWSTPVALTEEYQELSHELDYSDVALSFVNLVMELKNEGEAQIDWTRLTAETDQTVKITPQSGVFVRGDDTIADIQLRTNRPNGKFFYFTQTPGSEKIVPNGELTADADGVVTVPGAALPNDPVSYDLLLGLAGNGMYRGAVPGHCHRCRFAMNIDKYFGVVRVTRIAAADWDEMLAAAKTVNPEGKRRMLVLADSIWDFDRGGNVADLIGFFLEQAHGGSFQIRNYAVHGDNVFRMMCRFAGRFKEVEHGRDRYQTIREENPELVLFMLGHNDTVVSSRDNFQTPKIPAEKQLSAMKGLMTDLKKQWPDVRVALLSPLNADIKSIRAKAEKRLQENPKAVIFRYGDDAPLAAYRKNLDIVAKEFNFPVWNVFESMADLENKPSYFYPDGVHLSPKGHILLTKLVLKEMAK